MNQMEEKKEVPPVPGSRDASYESPEMCKLLGLSYPTVLRWVREGRIPKPGKMGRNLRWDRQVIDAWLAAGCPKNP